MKALQLFTVPETAAGFSQHEAGFEVVSASDPLGLRASDSMVQHECNSLAVSSVWTQAPAGNGSISRRAFHVEMPDGVHSR